MALADWKREKKIGRGGQGETILVSHVNTGQLGVLKIIHNNSPKQRARLLTEVTNLRIVRENAGLVPGVLEDNTSEFETAKDLYFVMTYFEGPTLGRFIQERGALPMEDAVRVIVSLASTLAIAHGLDIAHRDIKPQNIIIENDKCEDAVLLDFGLSFTETDTEKTEIGEQIGNRFMALPEGQAYGPNRDPRSDVTQLVGIFLYLINGGLEPRVLLDEQGRPPHRRENTAPKLEQGDLRKHALEGLFTRGFALRLDERFQSVGEFLNRLRQVVDNPQSIEEAPNLETAAREATKRILNSNAKIQRSVLMQNLAMKIAQARNGLYAKYGRDKELDGFTVGVSRVTVEVNQNAAGYQIDDNLKIDSLQFYIVHSHTRTQYSILYNFVLSAGTEIGFVRVSSLKNEVIESSDPFLWMTEENQDIIKQWNEDIDREMVKGINRIADSL